MADLDAIVRIAAIVHPDYPESGSVFTERLALHPSGVLVAERQDGPVAYAIGHPWRGDPPPLDRCLGTLPDRPDRYQIHDVALIDAARRLGLGRAVLGLLRADAAKHELRALSPVAVGNAAGYWRRAGFMPDPEPLVPACYGGGIAMRMWLA